MRIANELVIHGLVRKYAELAGDYERLKKDTARVADEVDHVRAVILIFDPRPKRTRAPTPTAGTGP